MTVLPAEALSVPVVAPSDIARLTDLERRRLASWLAHAEPPHELSRPARRRRRTMLAASTIAALMLVPWLAVLAATLPDRHRDHEWRLAWVGFDAVLALAFAATAWFGWRNRQIVISAVVVTATLLLSDAWFDVVLSWGGPEQRGALLAAALGEVPFAAFLLVVYHRLLRAMVARTWHDRGLDGEPPALRHLPLLWRRVGTETDARSLGRRQPS